MNYPALSALVQTHPQWPTVTDADLVAWCNEESVSKIRDHLSTEAIFAAIAANPSDFTSLSDAAQQRVWNVLSIHSASGVPTDPSSPARQFLQTLFSGKTDTLQALGAAMTYTISRAANIGITETIQLWDAEEARRLAGV